MTAGLSHRMPVGTEAAYVQDLYLSHDAQRRQHIVPVGWWYGDCRASMDDLR